MTVEGRLYPGPQKQLKRTWFGSVALASLVVGMTLVTLFSLLQANAELLALSQPDWIWKIAILKPDQSIAILVGLLTLIVVRKQAAFGLRPQLVYEGRISRSPMVGSTEESKSSSKTSSAWEVRVINAGSGAALIQDAKYSLRLSGESDTRRDLSYHDMLSHLKAFGLVWGRDLIVSHISSGFAFGTSREKVVFVVSLGCYSQIEVFDIVLRYRSILRDEFEKEIFCIPRVRQLQPSTLDSSGIIIPT